MPQDLVRDGRDLMENDGIGPRFTQERWTHWVETLGWVPRADTVRLLMDAPDHPNYRYGRP